MIDKQNKEYKAAAEDFFEAFKAALARILPTAEVVLLPYTPLKPSH